MAENGLIAPSKAQDTPLAAIKIIQKKKIIHFCKEATLIKFLQEFKMNS
jgi:hypothetical protein